MARNPGPVTISRRALLRTAGAAMIGVAGGVLAACGPAAPTTPPVQPTVAQPPAAAAQPTAVAAATPASATQAGAAAKPGRQLIGKLEGPSVVTDPAQFPKKFAE